MAAIADAAGSSEVVLLTIPLPGEPGTSGTLSGHKLLPISTSSPRIDTLDPPPACVHRDSFTFDGILVPGVDESGHLLFPKHEYVKHDSPFIFNGKKGDTSKKKVKKLNWPMCDLFMQVSIAVDVSSGKCKSEDAFADLLQERLKEAIEQRQKQDGWKTPQGNAALKLFQQLAGAIDLSHVCEEGIEEDVYNKSAIASLVQARFPLR